MSSVRDGGYVVVGWHIGNPDNVDLERVRALAATLGDWLVLTNGSGAWNDAVLGLPVVAADAEFFEEGVDPEDLSPIDALGDEILATKKKAKSASDALAPVFAACRELELKVAGGVSFWLVAAGVETRARLTDGARVYASGPDNFGPTELKLRGLEGKRYPLVAWASPLD